MFVSNSVGKPTSLDQFKMKYSGWEYIRDSVDRITFTVSKKILLTSFGNYCSESMTINGLHYLLKATISKDKNC